MGKPTKPRVKGNLKPASSSRAAELAGAGSSLSFENLGGFAQFAGNTAAVLSRPSTPSSMDGYESVSSNDLDPELVVILKKISKRDTITKIKALEELETYLQANLQVVGSILHNWVTMYGKLVLEVDRRVRLNANQVHTLITTNAKKKLAPLLKEFIGPWMLSMYDQSKDVARVAQQSFETVFSAEKRLGVMSFCQKEILDYVTDMLLFKTAETLSDSRYVSKEDMQAKYARIVASSFQVVSTLISKLSIEERDKYQSEYNIILDDTTMWKKFATHSNPLIRKALYQFIRTLLLSWIEMVEARLDIICPHFYASVFTEKDTSTHSDMWDAFLLMTKKVPSSWIIIGKKKPALPKLYNFLRSGLNGSVNIAYPSMLALLANLPSDLKNTPNFYKDIFDNFWKGLSTEYIDKSNFHIFLNAYAECIVYFAITLSKSEETAASVPLLIDDIFNMVKIYFLNSRDKAINEKMDFNSYVILAKHLVVLASVNSVKADMTPFWTQLDELLIQTVVDCGSVATRAPLDMNVFSQKTGNFLTAVLHEMESTNNTKLDSLETFIKDLSQRLLVSCIESSIVYKDKSFGLLVLAKQLFKDSDKTDGLVYPTKQILCLLTDAPEDTTSPLVSFYVSLVAQLLKKDQKKDSQELWTDLVEKINDMFTTSGFELRSANGLVLVLEQLQTENIVLDASYQSDKLDSIVKESLVKLNQAAIVIPRAILENICALSLKQHLSFNLLSSETASNLTSTLESHLVDFNKNQYVDKKTNSILVPSVQTLKTTLSSLVILQKIFENSEDAVKFIQATQSIICELFDAIFVTTSFEEEELEEEDVQLALDISQKSASCWELLEKPIQAIHEWQQLLLERLRESILDIHYSASPSDSVQRFKKLLNCVDQQEAISVVMSTNEKWNELASASLGQKTNEYLSLGITNTYAGLSVEELIDDEGELKPVQYDVYGLSSFGRFALFVGEYFATTSSPVVSDWVVRQLMLTSIACEQGLTGPGLCRIWETKAIEGVHAFVQSTQQWFSDYLNPLIVGCVDNVSEWNQQLLDAVQGKSSENRLVTFISQLMLVKEGNATLVYSAELLQRVLQKLVILLTWQVSDLEKWLPLLKPESNVLDLLNKVAVLSAFKNELGSTDSYKHYQSDLASKLSGVNSFEKLDYDISDPDLKKKVNWSILGLFNASSLKVGAFDIPRQRLMYLVQAIRTVPQDAEYSSDQQKARIQAQWAQLLKHVANSIQEVSGSHWEFFVQCCYEWVAFADTTQPEELVVVYHALDLFYFLYDLADDHEELEGILKDHMPSISTSLLQLMAKEEEYLQLHPRNQKHNHVRLVYQTLLSELLEYIPETILIDNDCFKNLNVLIRTPNQVLQKRAYLLLKKFIAHRVQDLSVQLEFTETSDDSQKKVDIDEDIFNALLNPPDFSNWNFEEGHEIFGYLLTWMLMFDHFTDITFKLKQEYTSQLKDKEAVSYLVPLLCRVLSVGQAAASSKSFDLSPWSILEYDIDGFDMTAEMSFLILSSHVYYRALTHIPSLVRLWWIDCKQRQLTIAVENYTEKYFSQQLINHEMELVNRPDVKSQLEDNDENEFTVKTSKAANEVTATYRVDEQNMQIAIKLPSNFPLRQIDVEGIAKVGVNDKQWRGWMFAITAVIGSQNGNIVDALTVFKRNVNLHFNGVEDCTICYSIISVQDRSIPTKQCKTCKNKFHSSCLYKWFRSSNSASCPLCRTVF